MSKFIFLRIFLIDFLFRLDDTEDTERGGPMNIGNLPEDCEKALGKYKEWGFSTRTAMISEAIREFRRKKAKEERAQWRAEAHKEMVDVEYVWKDIDGEDFHE